MRKLTPLALILILILTLALPSCTRDDGTGKVFAFPLDAAPEHLDPAIAQTPEELLVINNIFEGLVRQNAEGEIIPGAAHAWNISPDGLVYTFHLREDAHWSLLRTADGTVQRPHRELLGDAAESFDTHVTAYDFVFGITRALLPATNSPGAAGLYAIQNARAVHEGRAEPEALGVAAINRLTLQITLEQPSTHFLYALTQSVAMPTNQVFFEATQGRFGRTAQHLLSNGPFYLNRWDSEENIFLRLRQNAGYHGEVTPFAVNLFVQPDPTARLNILGTDGGYDAAFVPAAFESHLPAGTQLTQLYNATLALIFRHENVNLRRALCAALDVAELGYEDPPGLLPAALHVGGDSLRSLVGPPAIMAHDIARAQELLSYADITRVTLTLICLPEHETLARRALQQWQQAFGMAVTVAIEPIENPEEFAGRLQRGNFDIAIASLQANSSFALQTLEDWAQPGSLLGYDSAQLQALLLAARAETSPLEIAQAVRNTEQHLLQSGVVVPLAPQASLLAVAPGISGFAASPVGDRVFFGDLRK